MRINIAFILLFTYCINVFSQDQSVSFIAEVSKKTLGINENVRVDFKMNQDGDNFISPSFEGFRVVGGPNQSVSNMWVNGKRTFSKIYSYYLSPLKTGSLSIGQATIEIDNQIYKTIPVKVKVSESITIKKDPNDASYVANENLHLVAEVSNNKPYLNQGFSVVYKLYFSPQINVTNVGEIDSPEYNDFWSHNIKIPRLQIERGTYKGESYNYVIWKKIVLYPQKSGILNILPLTLDVSVDVPTNKRDFFGNRIYTQVPKTVTAGKREINVLNLPKNAPENFNGAVGDFKIELSTTKNELNASESLQAILKVSGSGNIKLFSIPSLITPNSIEKYDPEYNENVKTNIKGMFGNISDTYTLVPQFKGKYPISPVEFVFFDPNIKKYKSIFSNEIIIDVLEGPSSYSSDNSKQVLSNSSINNISLMKSQFKFIKTKPNLISSKPYNFIYSTLFYLLIIIPIIMIVLVVVFFKSKKSSDSDIKGYKSRRANKLAKKYLSDAKRSLGKKEVFYVALEKALHNFLKSKLSIETSDYSKEKIQSLLLNKKIKNESVKLFIILIENCEYARYTPATNVGINNDYENAVNVIAEIDKQI
ncbi:MAG: BatD protein [Flavobacteriaceae bacterium]|nr:BatD protein [Flavobacteriaceae bacterium]|tara:strand:- start:3843 stop:5615 length:1773 start_codon:yes stop_codon:yes gene_type:complete